MKIRCIAVDDEPPALRQMEEYIRQVPYLDLLGSFSNPMDTLGFLKENKVDLIFLDIQME
ncbi:MAG: response regulator, partial [Bacteroidetes bacterium]|nr:response regulator [Bacteroidota bacterium]